jgi:hypothetical protein
MAAVLIWRRALIIVIGRWAGGTAACWRDAT